MSGDTVKSDFSASALYDPDGTSSADKDLKPPNQKAKHANIV
jgi:hypothetical protein